MPKMQIKHLLFSTCVLTALLGDAPPVSAAECGRVAIASMNWQSAEVLANIDKIILTNGYGCKAEVLIGDTVPTFTSMEEKGQPDIAPEASIGLLPAIVQQGLGEPS